MRSGRQRLTGLARNANVYFCISVASRFALLFVFVTLLSHYLLTCHPSLASASARGPAAPGLDHPVCLVFVASRYYTAVVHEPSLHHLVPPSRPPTNPQSNRQSNPPPTAGLESRRRRRWHAHGPRGRAAAAGALEGLVECPDGGVGLERGRGQGGALVHLLHLLPRAHEVALPQGVLRERAGGRADEERAGEE